MSSNDRFARNLVKGKIAETVFAQMLRETGNFTVLEFGYEKVIPDLIQHGYNYDEQSGVIETLRTAPDFAVINQINNQVKLIEVKYMHQFSKNYALKDARRMHQSWNPSYLFIATQDGFYFDEISEIINHHGDIAPLEHPHIPQDLQARYVQILRDLEADN